MKITHRIVGVLWIGICAYCSATLVQVVCEARPRRAETLAITLVFALLYLAGAITSFYVIIGARWARIVLSIIALLTVAASAMGLFAFFNSPPFSFVGTAFDTFALASAGVLLFARKYVVA